MKKLLLGVSLMIIFVSISYLFGHDPSYLECFLFGIVAGLLSDDILNG